MRSPSVRVLHLGGNNMTGGCVAALGDLLRASPGLARYCTVLYCTALYCTVLSCTYSFSHGGEIFIHTLSSAAARSTLEDPPSISEVSAETVCLLCTDCLPLIIRDPGAGSRTTG